jgi:maltose/moltooligosaccharide transporter
MLTILYTILTTKEYSPEEFAAFEDGKEIVEEHLNFAIFSKILRTFLLR